MSADAANMIASARYVLGEDATAEEIARELHWSINSVRRWLEAEIED